MNALVHLAGLGLDVLEAWPWRRLPLLAVMTVAIVAIVWPDWLLQVMVARYQPLVDRIIDVLSSRVAGS